MKNKIKPEFALNDREHLDEFIEQVQKNMKVDNDSTEKLTYQAILDPYIKKFDPDIYAILQAEGEFYTKQGDINIFRDWAYSRMLTPDITTMLQESVTRKRKIYREGIYRTLVVLTAATIGYFGCQAINKNKENSVENITLEIKNNSNEFYFLTDSLTQERLMQIVKRLEKNGSEYTLGQDSVSINLGQGIIRYEKPTGTHRILWRRSALTNNHSCFVNIEYEKPTKIQADLNVHEYDSILQQVIGEIEAMRRNNLPSTKE